MNEKGYLDGKCREFHRLKERILLLERVILHTIGFELSISHPYIHFGKVSEEFVLFCFDGWTLMEVIHFELLYIEYK